MKVRIIQTITCKHCKEPFEFELLPVFRDLAQGKSGNLRCPHCHFANPVKLNRSLSPLLASPESFQQIMSNIEEELNRILALRLKEKGFLRFEAK